MHEHHTQRIDFGENDFLEATRDDSEELLDFHLKAFMPDGKLVREIRIVYNIQYDYWRRQEWKAGALIYDSLGSKGEGDTGHLQWEYSLQEPPDDWKTPYPDNYEPAKKEGCDMFHWEGYKFDAYFYENFEEHFASESEELAKNPFNPELARKKRLEYGKVIGVTIPYDSRFID